MLDQPQQKEMQKKLKPNVREISQPPPAPSKSLKTKQETLPHRIIEERSKDYENLE
jgi:hypothetical protein